MARPCCLPAKLTLPRQLLQLDHSPGRTAPAAALEAWLYQVLSRIQGWGSSRSLSGHASQTMAIQLEGKCRLQTSLERQRAAPAGT
mmetsp:Transcript_2352/g.4335  ORF Transcript_2352/g.4335 Transcript_2352/m.4335 type:complete len:86 (-) Transcript_2352:3-260(-)